MGFSSHLLCVSFCFIHIVQSEVNLSIGRTSRQSTTHGNYKPAKGVDGCTSQNIRSGCCSHTSANEKEAWWQVDLGTVSTISHIKIYYRDEPSVNNRARFAGYQLYLSNTTDWRTGILCNQDTSSSLEAVKLINTHQCPYVAQYVTIYNYRNDPKRYTWYYNDALLELCEVQVFGCPTGKYGLGNCDQRCPDRCVGGNCKPVNGYCFYCQLGKWGDICGRNCPNGCLEDCHIQSGLCTECKTGKYSDTCNRDCHTECVGGCEQDSGFCGDCRAGKFGQTCQLFCPTHCSDDGCDKDSGSCVDCKVGKHGERCELDCPETCKGLHCEQNTGFCSECNDGMYGYGCNKSCPSLCGQNKCRRYDGACQVTDNDSLATGQCHSADNIPVIAVLATISALCLVVAIVSFVCMLRTKAGAKRERSERQKQENHYTDIDISPRNASDIYVIPPE